MPANKESAWDAFAPFEAATTVPAGDLVARAAIQKGERVLDVGCGTGVVALTAARMGGRVTGLDPSKALLKRALENGELAEIDIDWLQGTAESIPFPDKSFDVVLSQYGHIFAPNAQRTIDEMLRILKPGGRLTVSVWDADHYMGLQFAILGRHGLKDFTAPIIWGRESERTRLFAGRLENIKNATGYLRAPCLSPNHVYRAMARSIWPVTQLLDQLSDDPVATRNLKQELLDLIVQSTEGTVIPQRYTIVTGVKS